MASRARRPAARAASRCARSLRARGGPRYRPPGEGLVATVTGWQRPTARRVRALRARLREMYGVPVMAPHGDPLGELVLTVLSQSTNDRNRDVAFLRLRDRFPAWEAVRDAPVGEIEEAIRPGGISKVKSVRIQA